MNERASERLKEMGSVKKNKKKERVGKVRIFPLKIEWGSLFCFVLFEKRGFEFFLFFIFYFFCEWGD